MLTRKQHELLMLIHSRLQKDGIPPSFDEMKDALHLKSKSGIHRLITALEERGFIRRLPNRARALEVIKMPEGYQPLEGDASQSTGFTPDVIEGGRSTSPASNVTAVDFGRGDLSDTPDYSRSRRGGLASRFRSADRGAAGDEPPAPAQPDQPLPGEANNDRFEVPVMGRIAAGVPISAIQQVTHNMMVPPSMIGMGKHFALEVRGDSMIEAGILDGDTVVIQETAAADPGDIVVALVDDEEATLKRFRTINGKIALEAANPAYEVRILEPQRVKVQGKLAGLIRQY